MADASEAMSFDYVVVGAGTAGCILAASLAERAGTRVALLEAGHKADHMLIRMPLAFGKALKHPDLTWQVQSPVLASLGGRVLGFPRGKVLGGTSAINGMIHTRGTPEDFDDWASEGCTGWSFADVEGCFKRAEQRLGIAGSMPSLADTPAIAAAFAKASAASAPGVATPPQVAIRKGRRMSAARALSKAVTVIRDCRVERVLMRDGRVRAVSARIAGRIRTIEATAEVILCAGSFQTPDILFHSGIGDGAILRAAGIGVAHHLPGVGQNLQDHFGIPLSWEARNTQTLNRLLQSRPRLALEALRWGLAGKGALARPLAEVLFFARSHEDAPRPDIELILRVIHGSGADGVSGQPGFSVNAIPLKPLSRGTVAPGGATPETAPRVDPGYLTANSDVEVSLRAVRLARRVAAAVDMHAFRGPEIAPGSTVEADDALLDYIRSNGTSASHHVGTCKMGQGSDAVVDPLLRVHGVPGLRIADGSIMPTLPGAHPNAAIMMIAEKAGEIIAGAAP
ncbi:GMC family oxidoreductase [Tropicimonas sp. S265A]|uniref:GMC family oxidoreductase n=1 Tax=Tropicimonas sp. S265A TaxID=3415134 RepID=UPI003C79A8F3